MDKASFGEKLVLSSFFRIKAENIYAEKKKAEEAFWQRISDNLDKLYEAYMNGE